MNEFTIFSIPTWVLWAIGIAVVFSVGLNGGGFLPWLRDLRPSRIEARWVGYAGLTVALWLWIIFNPEESASHTGIAWLIICLATLIPNTVMHLHERDGGNNHSGSGMGDAGSNNDGGRRPNDPTRMRDLVLNIIAERWQAHEALRAQDEMLHSLITIVDPAGSREPEGVDK